MKKILSLLLLAVILTGCGKSLELNVLSFNIRYDNPGDEFNSWQFRKEAVTQLIRHQDADIVGTQEVLQHQLEGIKVLLPEYTYLGVGREDGDKKGEYCALMFKTNKFDNLQSGYFWLSETPDVAGSKGWDGACERIATWAILKDKITQKSLFVINTHLDHMGKIARQEGVSLLLDQVEKLSNGLPVIITGDFNATPKSEVILHVLDTSVPRQLYHSKDIADETIGTNWTFHGFGNVPESERQFIDYIFVTDGVKVKSHEVLPAKFNDRYVSDHSVVKAKIKLKD
jgi:Metal-dependent hydrolase